MMDANPDAYYGDTTADLDGELNLDFLDEKEESEE
jgi:hypothetical protein